MAIAAAAATLTLGMDEVFRGVLKLYTSFLISLQFLMNSWCVISHLAANCHNNVCVADE